MMQNKNKSGINDNNDNDKSMIQIKSMLNFDNDINKKDDDSKEQMNIINDLLMKMNKDVYHRCTQIMIIIKVSMIKKIEFRYT